MALLKRNTRIEDFEACFDLVSHDAPFLLKIGPKATELSKLWTHLIQSGDGISAVVEDEDVSPHKVVGFGMSLFVTDTFMEACVQNPERYILHRLMELWQQGTSPILSYRDIKRCNSHGGLNLLGLHSSWIQKFEPDTDGAKAMLLRDQMRKSLLRLHKGFKLKSYFKEVYGDAERKRYVDFGMSVWPSESFYDERNARLTIASARTRPYLVGITRDEALSVAKELCFARPLFADYHPPKYSLTRCQQEMLLQALHYETDKDIAKALWKGHAAVRQMWKRIAVRIDIDDIEFSLNQSDAPNEDSVGKIRKNRIVTYLNNHPSELRPHEKQGKNSG